MDIQTDPVPQTAYAGQGLFLTEITPTGSGLLYSTDSFGGNSLTIDSSDNLYLAASATNGYTTTTGAFQPTCVTSCVNAIVTKFVPGDQVWPTVLNFGNQTVGITSQALTTSLTNSGPTGLNITSIVIAGTNSSDFTETNNCGAELLAGSSCTITITTTPTAAGNRNANLDITDAAANSPQSVSLLSVGLLPAVTLSPTSLTFPTQVVFTASKAQTVTLTNTGLGTLSITNISVSSPFSQTNTCGTSVAAGASCTLTLIFRPAKIGTQTGSLSITDNATASPQKLGLIGIGTYVQLAPTSLNFGNQPVGTKSASKKITLSNKGSVSVSIASIAVTGADKGDFAETNTCGKSVASGANCSITVSFTPSATGKRTASISVSDNGGGSPQAVGLTGTGTR